MLIDLINVLDKRGQKESGRRLFLASVLAACVVSRGVRAQSQLDAGGLTYKDFGISDNGASFYRTDRTLDPNYVANTQPAKVLSIDSDKGIARVRFNSVKVELGLPLGWQADEDWERGVGFSSDRRYRVIVWRVDFAFEGVRDAEHYAATKTGAIKARRPGIQAQARKLSDGTFLIVYENVPPGHGDSERRTVFDLVMANPRNPKMGVLVTIGVPASETDRGLKLAALLKGNIKIDW